MKLKKKLQQKYFEIYKNNFIIFIAISLILPLFIIIYIGFLRDTIEGFENHIYDLKIRLFIDHQSYIDPDIMTLTYDDKDEEFVNTHPEVGLTRWPFPRKAFGNINDYLIRGNSQLNLFDITFQNQTDPENDDSFAKSLKLSNSTMLAVNPSLTITNTKYTLKQIDGNPYLNKHVSFINRLDNNMITAFENIFAKKYDFQQFQRFTYPLKIDKKSLNKPILVSTSIAGLLLPYEKFVNSVSKVFCITLPSQKDNIIRTTYLFERIYKNKIVPSYALAPSLELLPENNKKISLDNNVFQIGDKKIPLNNDGTVFINYKKINSESILLFSGAYIYEKFYTLDWRNGYNILPEEENYFLQAEYKYLYDSSSGPVTNAINFLENTRLNFLKNPDNAKNNDQLASYPYYFKDPSKHLYYKNYLLGELSNLERYKMNVVSPDTVTGKIIIVGNGTVAGDSHSTIIGKIPGIQMIANTIDNVLNDRTYIHKSPLLLNIFIIFIMILLSIRFVLKTQDNITLLVGFFGILFVYTWINLVTFNIFKLWLPFVEPVLIVFIFFIFSLITQNFLTKEDLKKTYKLATTDGLTGLYNHRYFQEKMVNKIEEVKRKEDSFSLLLIDIDFFKKFNDTYGHRAGDAVLIQVGTILKKNVRSQDTVCRYGGEEMCVILDKTNTDEAIVVANKLVEAIADTDFNIQVDDKFKTVKVTISVGVSNYPDHSDSTQGLIEFSDQGLYRAKEGGRNQVGTLEDVLQESNSDKPVVSKELEIAKAKVKKEYEKIITICNEKDIDYRELVNQLLDECVEENKPS